MIEAARLTRVRELQTALAKAAAENRRLQEENAELLAHFDLAVLAAGDLASLPEDGKLVVVDGWNMILGAFTSGANLAIVPMQDILSLDGEARMNTPGVAAGNWQWRIGRGALDAAIENTAPFLRGLCEISGRETPLEMKQIPQNLLKFLSEK